MASVKRFHIERPPTETELGRGAFEFTDAYSVFDWGQMPDAIPKKGEALCLMGAANFEALEAADIPTHYLGVGDENQSASAVDEPTRRMGIELTQTPKLPYNQGTYDYDSFHEAAGVNYLIPLEIVFRNEIPIGSSLRRRSDPEDHALAYDAWPDETVTLAEPIIEFSTKFEETDRYLSNEEADRIAGPASIGALRSLARQVNRVITDRAADHGLTHLDGKIECLYHEGTIKVADVVGTFDENRFAYDGRQLSKEVVRQYYKRTQPAWIEAIAEAKATAEESGIADWRTTCSTDPAPLPEDVLELVSDMYAAGANTFLDRQLFAVPPIHTVAAEIAALDDRTRESSKTF